MEENETLKEKISRLEIEKKTLNAKIYQLMLEFEVIDWYTEVMENGLITKDLCLEIVQVKE